MATIAGEASKIKNQGIEVFTVGVGNAIDMQQLNALASDSNHVLTVRNHDSIYESIGDILNSICMVHAKVNLDQVVSLPNLGQDDYR